MKIVFGSRWLRLWRGGITLVRDALPEHLVHIFDRQIDAMNLVQRMLVPSHKTGRAAWRGLHFYRINHGRVDRSDLPKLPIKDGEILLVRLKLSVGATGEVLNVTATAVNGCFFDIQSGEDWRPLANEGSLSVLDVHQSWRSNVVSQS